MMENVGEYKHRSDIELAAMLKESFIQAEQQYRNPPKVAWIGDSVIATLGNFSVSSGKAKAKKTFNVSAFVAAALKGGKVLNYEAHLPEGKQRVLYVDTEQSRYHCHRVLTRILTLAGFNPEQSHPNLEFIGLREHTPAMRIQLIDYAIRNRRDYGLVVIDGVRDLLIDINSITESQEVVNKMMQWTGRYDLHVHGVVHLNKSDDTVRGHLGTELSNKAESVIVVSKSLKDSNVSEVRSVHVRDKDFAPFAFRIDEDGLPVDADGYECSNHGHRKTKLGYAELSMEQHEVALRVAFGERTAIKGYDPMLDALREGYGVVGFDRKRTAMSKLLNYLIEELKLVTKSGKVYQLREDAVHEPKLELDEDDEYEH